MIYFYVSSEKRLASKTNYSYILALNFYHTLKCHCVNEIFYYNFYIFYLVVCLFEEYYTRDVINNNDESLFCLRIYSYYISSKCVLITTQKPINNLKINTFYLYLL